MKNTVLFLILLIIIGSASHKCNGELYSIEKLTKEQNEFLVRENKLYNISFGLTEVGLAAMMFPSAVENNVTILTAICGSIGLIAIADALFSNKRPIGQLIYNKEKGLYLKRILTNDQKMSYGLSYLSMGVLTIGMGISLNNLFSEYGLDSNYGMEAFIVGGALITLSGAILFFDSFHEFPEAKEEGYHISKQTDQDRFVHLNFALNPNYIGIRVVKTF